MACPYGPSTSTAAQHLNDYRFVETGPAISETHSVDNFSVILSTNNQNLQTAMPIEIWGENTRAGGGLEPNLSDTSDKMSRATLGVSSLVTPEEGAVTTPSSQISTSARSEKHSFKTLTCSFSDCHDLSFDNLSKLREHISRKHSRHYKCLRCHRRFGSASDRARHVRTLHGEVSGGMPTLESACVCREVNCKRNGKPFSRRDNYVKHLREVHGKETKTSGRRSREGVEGSVQDESSKMQIDGDVAIGGASGIDGKGLDRRIGLEESGGKEQLTTLSREELFQLLLQEQEKTRILEEDLRGYKKREEVFLGVLAGKFDSSRK